MIKIIFAYDKDCCVMNIQQQISAVKAELEVIKKCEKRLIIIDHSLRDYLNDLDLLSTKVEKEYKDVLYLQNLSTGSLYYKILGDFKEQMAKEREEYLLEVLKYDNVLNKIELLSFELNILNEKVTGKQKLEKELENLLRDNYLFIKNDVKHTFHAALLNLESKIEKYKYILNEIDEADISIEKLKSYLEKLSKEMTKFDPWAQNFGTRQMLTYDQKAFIKRFRKELSMIDLLGIQVNKELADISGEVEISYDYGDFIKFFDGMYSSTIDTWYSSTYLRKAKTCIKENIHKMDHKKANLTELRSNTHKQILLYEAELKLYLQTI